MWIKEIHLKLQVGTLREERGRPCGENEPPVPEFNLTRP